MGFWGQALPDVAILDPSAIKLLTRLLAYNPAHRPSAEEVLMDDYFLEVSVRVALCVPVPPSFHCSWNEIVLIKIQPLIPAASVPIPLAVPALRPEGILYPLWANTSFS